jgi:predicted DNA-binding antitoxin AbrB/MazE fold protein
MTTSVKTRIETMSGTFRARFKAGVLELLDAVNLSEGAEVSVTIIESAAKKDTRAESMRDALNATAGAWKGLIDAETLKRNIYEDRLIDTRPVPKL